jgi:UDP-N-acetylmuramoylalanine-D-glutamate ligase
MRCNDSLKLISAHICGWPVCRDDQGVLWVNDSKATNVDATLVGLRGIVGKKAVVMLGGLAKVAVSPFCIFL